MFPLDLTLENNSILTFIYIGGSISDNGLNE